MSSILATAVTGLVLTTALVGASVTMTQAQADQGKEAAHSHNMTSDLQHCQTDLVMDAGFTGGRYTQADAAATVAACEVTAGTVLTVHVSADGRNFTLTASSDAVSGTLVADTATGGAVQAIGNVS
jgi:uridylate kinase